MSSLIKFQALSGAKDERPYCYLLQLDQITILLDCGWTDAFDVSQLEGLKRYSRQIDLVLISHGDLEHVGALPYLVKMLQLNCPMYATLAACNMGRICLEDAWKAKRLWQDFDLFSMEDIQHAFDRITPLKYSENIALAGESKRLNRRQWWVGKCLGVSVVPLAAGHTIGGTVWRIKKDTDEIVYAVSYNHKKERHLNGTVLGAFSRPSLLITDAYNASNVQPTRKQRDSELLDALLQTLRSDGSVLMPIDSSTRILELSFLLDQLWSYHQLSFPLVFLSSQSNQTMEYAKGMLEWMGDTAMDIFSSTRETPFDFKHLRLMHSLAELEKLGDRPKVVLSSMPSLDSGFARDLFFKWSLNNQNLILLTNRSDIGSTARQLYEQIHMGGVFELKVLEVTRKVALEGDELAKYLQAEQDRKEREEFIARKKRILEGDEESEGEDDLDQQLLFLGDHYDYYNRGEKTTGLSFFANDSKTVMYPSAEVRTKYDDYGEAIDIQDFTKDQFEDLQRQQNPEAMQVDERKKDDDELVPSKYINQQITVDVQCLLKYIDFEGLSDGKSIKNILQNVNPKKLILIRGSLENTDELKSHLSTLPNPPDEIFTPASGELINVSASTNIYQVKLTDALVTSLKMAKMGEYELAFIHGVIRQPNAYVSPPASPKETNADEDVDMDRMSKTEPEKTLELGRQASIAIPSLDVLPFSERWKGHASLVIGDIKLSELKRVLQNEGIVSDFEKGALIVGTKREIRVTKDESGDGLVIEGPFSKVYYRVRSLIYKMHAFV